MSPKPHAQFPSLQDERTIGQPCPVSSEHCGFVPGAISPGLLSRTWRDRCQLGVAELWAESPLRAEFHLSRCLLQNNEFIHSALAETNTRHGELQWRNIGYFIVNGTIQENGKLMLQSLNSLMASRLQTI